MEPEVIATLIGTPAVLVAATAAWMAGRAQGRGTYHGSVDAVRRAAQREAYADLYRAGRRFIHVWEKTETAMQGLPSNAPVDLLPADVLAMLDEVREVQDALEHSVDMARLEGPDRIAEIADRIWSGATGLAGRGLIPSWGRTMPAFDTSTPEALRRRNEAMELFSTAHRELLVEARAYLNGGPARR